MVDMAKRGPSAWNCFRRDSRAPFVPDNFLQENRNGVKLAP